MKPHLEEGGKCPGGECPGKLKQVEPENCACHIRAPCGWCSVALEHLKCDSCGTEWRVVGETP